MKVDHGDYAFNVGGGVKLPDYAEGEHLWVMIPMYRVEPAPGKPLHLDQENLISLDGPGCWWCKAIWSADVEVERCSGTDNEH